jgi:molecular chaperone IbpA
MARHISQIGDFVPTLLKEDVVMRTLNFAPLFRSTVGFDRLFDLMDETARPDWPPYNIEKSGDANYRIRMAVAGFGPDDVEVTQQGNTLTVAGQKTTEQGNSEILHQGLAFWNFRQTFSLADHVKVASANLQDGLLAIELVREVPEELKPRRIELSGRAAAVISAQNNQPKLMEGAQDRTAKVA